MSLLGWRSRAGLCLMRSRPGATPCVYCLGERLREAGFSPRGPLAIAPDPVLEQALDASGLPPHPLCAPVLRLEGERLVVHALLALPACPHCAAAQRRSPAAPKLPTGAAFNPLLDPLLGIGSWLQRTEAGPGEARLCDALAGQVHTPGNRHPISARGQGLDPATAALGHLGETVERYAAFRPDPSRLRWARAGELPGPALLGPALFGFDAAQRAAAGYAGLDGRRRLAWIEGRRLRDAAPCWVPAAAVYLSRDWGAAGEGGPTEPRIGPSVSHGLAAHRSAGAAIDHAALELLERAAMTRAWHRQAFGQRLDPADLDEGCQALCVRVRDAGLQFALAVVAPPPAMPVVMALLSGDHPPWFLFGAGAKASLAEAARAALLEACCGWQALVQRPEAAPKRFRLRQTEDARGHHRYYAGADRAAAVVAAFLAGLGPAPSRWPRARSRLAAPALLVEHAPEAVAIDLTPADCAATGFSVQRVIAPGLPVYAFGRIGTPRGPMRAAGLPESPMPHPFR